MEAVRWLKGAPERIEGIQEREGRLKVQWEDVIEAFEEVKGERWREFAGRYGDVGRDVVLWLALESPNLTLEEIGRRAGGIRSATASQAVSRAKADLSVEGKCARLRQKARERLRQRAQARKAAAFDKQEPEHLSGDSAEYQTVPDPPDPNSGIGSASKSIWF